MAFFRVARRYMDEAGDADGSGGTVDYGNDPTAAADDAGAADDEAAAAVARDEKGRFAAKKDDGDGDTPDEGTKLKGTIPAERHKEVLEKERARTAAAEARAAELEKQIQQVNHNVDLGKIETEIEALEAALEDARLDGDKEKSRLLSRELRMKERQVSIAESTRMSESAKVQAREEMKLDMTIEKLELQYDVLNENSESYDQDVVDLVLATQRDLIQRERLMPAKALEEATRKVMAKLMPAHDDGGKAGGLKDAKKDSAGRKEQQVKKNVETAKKQPASMKESGQDADKLGQTKDIPNIEDMTFEEFAALPEATKSRMRGDSL